MTRKKKKPKPAKPRFKVKVYDAYQLLNLRGEFDDLLERITDYEELAVQANTRSAQVLERMDQIIKLVGGLSRHPRGLSLAARIREAEAARKAAAGKP